MKKLPAFVESTLLTNTEPVACRPRCARCVPCASSMSCRYDLSCSWLVMSSDRTVRGALASVCFCERCSDLGVALRLLVSSCTDDDRDACVSTCRVLFSGAPFSCPVFEMHAGVAFAPARKVHLAFSTAALAATAGPNARGKTTVKRKGTRSAIRCPLLCPVAGTSVACTLDLSFSSWVSANKHHHHLHLKQLAHTVAELTDLFCPTVAGL